MVLNTATFPVLAARPPPVPVGLSSPSSGPLWNELLLLRFICHLGSLPATELLSGVFLVPDIPLKLLNSSLRPLANGDLQPGGVLQNGV